MKQRKHKQRYAIGEVVTTDFEDVPRAITGANWNGLTWLYSFDGSDMSCGEEYLNVHTQPKDESKEVKQPYYKGKGEHSVNELETICQQYDDYISYLKSK